LAKVQPGLVGGENPHNHNLKKRIKPGKRNDKRSIRAQVNIAGKKTRRKATVGPWGKTRVVQLPHSRGKAMRSG